MSFHSRRSVRHSTSALNALVVDVNTANDRSGHAKDAAAADHNKNKPSDGVGAGCVVEADSDDMLYDDALQIYETYMCEGAPLELNLPFHVIQPYHDLFDARRGSSVAEQQFEAVQSRAQALRSSPRNDERKNGASVSAGPVAAAFALQSSADTELMPIGASAGARSSASVTVSAAPSQSSEALPVSPSNHGDGMSPHLLHTSPSRVPILRQSPSFSFRTDQDDDGTMISIKLSRNMFDPVQRCIFDLMNKGERFGRRC